MADIDVAAIALTSPPVAAPVTTYRPAVSVKNNGLAATSVSGVLRIYHRAPPGDLVATHQLSLSNLPAGATGDALAAGYWTPTEDEIGQEFLFLADVTCPNDQVEPNNHLGPVTVLVTGGEPPPPPVVTAHATQHEAGGTDVINVAGLPGELSEDQPPKDHASKHEQGGGDEMNIGGLHGVTADAQLAAAHGNERHLETFASAADIATAVSDHNEDTTPHDLASNLEKKANKNTWGGYAGLDPEGYLDASVYKPFGPAALVMFQIGSRGDYEAGVSAADHIHRGPGGLTAVSNAALPGLAGTLMSRHAADYFFTTSKKHALLVKLFLSFKATPGDILTISLYYTPQGGAGVQIGTATITFIAGTGTNEQARFEMICTFTGGGSVTSAARYGWSFSHAGAALGAPGAAGGSGAGATFQTNNTGGGDLALVCAWTGPNAMTAETGFIAHVCDNVDTT